MEAPKPTADEQAEADRQKLVSLEGQTGEFREAVRQALNTVNMEIVANDGKPQIDAAVAAMTSVIAEFIAMAPDRGARRYQLAAVEKNMRRFVALRTSSGGAA